MSEMGVYVLKKSAKAFIAFIFLIFLVLNIAASQFLPTSYFTFVEGDKASAVQLLKAVKFLPEFTTLIDRQRQIYGSNLDNELFSTEINREEKIMRLEQLAQQYPKSRDILYGLYLLYNDEGNAGKATAYLQRAKAIDPSIGK